MKWSNKIIHCKGDSNDSRLSSRSMSKFKKVNLQGLQLELSSNHQLEKSQLKLTSVQKIKQNHLNKSYISNYINTSRNNLNNSNDTKQNNLTDVKYPILNNLVIKEQQMQVSKSQQNILFRTFQGKYNKHIENKNQYSVFQGPRQANFQKDPRILSSQPKFNFPFLHQQTLTNQQKLSQFINKFHSLLIEFKQTTQIIKKQMNNQALSIFAKIQKEIQQKLKSFEAYLKVNISKIATIVNDSKKISTKQQSSQSKLKENPVISNYKTNHFAQIHSPPTSQGHQILKTFQQQSFTQQVSQKPYTLNRPSSYKNRFKQMLGNCTQPVLINQKNQQQVCQNNQNNRTSPKKILRKRTGPSPRVNSFMGNDSSLFQQQNDSLNQLKYRKIADKSASKSVKKLHQKIVSIKKMLNSNMNQKTIDQQPKITVNNVDSNS